MWLTISGTDGVSLSIVLSNVIIESLLGPGPIDASEKGVVNDIRTSYHLQRILKTMHYLLHCYLHHYLHHHSVDSDEEPGLPPLWSVVTLSEPEYANVQRGTR